MKDIGTFKKSESSLRRILLGDINNGKQGFKEKVPGFSYDKVEISYNLNENRTGKTRALCYMYDGDLFDELPGGMDVVDAIKNSTFVNCDYEMAEALELAFKEDPSTIYKLKDNSGGLEKWKQETRNQKKYAEISKNQQNSNALISTSDHSTDNENK